MRRPVPQWAWPALAALVATLPVAHGISNARVFHFRDLMKYFWPYHQWTVRTISSGHLPLWDPGAGGGYPAIADPTFQLLFPPTLLLRLLLPEALGFNLAVVACFPVAALGTFLWLRRHATGGAAAAGAIVFAASGPVLSCGNVPNLAWSVALAPYALWGVDAVVARSGSRAVTRAVAGLGVAFGLQSLAGETMTLVATAALAVAYAAWRGGEAGAGWAVRARAVAWVVAGGLAGLLLSAVQVLPLVDAVGRSLRGAGEVQDMWSLHPARLVETVAPFAFGSVLEPVGQKVSWYRAFDGREPLLLSLYVGVPALALAVAGTVAPRRRAWAVFWGAACVAALLFALGAHTPVYAFLHEHAPLVRSFRFPSKFVVFAVLAVAALAAAGWDALADDGARGAAWAAATAGAVAAVAGALLVWSVTPHAAAALAGEAAALGLPDAALEAERMAAALPAACGRVLGVSAVAALLVWLAPRAPGARGALLALVALDLVLAGAGVNPTLDVAAARPSPWVAEVKDPRSERVFVTTGRDLAYNPVPYLESPIPPEVSTATVSSLFGAAFPPTTSGVGLRSPIDIGVAALRPVYYERLLAGYDAASPAERARFLERNCVRYYVTIAPPAPDARRVAAIADFDSALALYERPVRSPRVEVVARHVVVPDEGRRAAALFSYQLDPSAEVVLARDPPEPAGDAGAGAAAAAEVVDEAPDAVAVRAGVPEGGGFLVLRDAYDPNWRVEVDGREAELLHANAMHRAVRLAPGSHDVRFVYRPRSLTAGAVVSLAALALVLVLMFLPRRVSANPTNLHE